MAGTSLNTKNEVYISKPYKRPSKFTIKKASFKPVHEEISVAGCHFRPHGSSYELRVDLARDYLQELCQTKPVEHHDLGSMHLLLQ